MKDLTAIFHRKLDFPLNLDKAALKRPQSRRFAMPQIIWRTRQRLDCACLSTALRDGVRRYLDFRKWTHIGTMNQQVERRFPNRLEGDSINLPIWRSALRFMGRGRSVLHGICLAFFITSSVVTLHAQDAVTTLAGQVMMN